MPDPFVLGALCAIGLLAFTTEGAVGFGGTVIAASLAAQLVPLEYLLPAFVPLNMALSAWLLARGRAVIPWRLLLVTLAPPLLVGLAIGIGILRAVVDADDPTAGAEARLGLQLAFALFVIGLAAVQLRAARASGPARALSPLARHGYLLVGGIIHGMYGTGGPLVVYVLRRHLADKAAFRATLAVIWLGLNVALVTNFVLLRLFTGATWWLVAALGVTLPLGTFLGERLFHRLDPRRFELAVWSLLAVAASILAVRTALALL